MEALKAIKEGKKVRRKHWDTMSGFALFESKGVGLVFTNNRFSDKITVADVEATDWEVVDEEKDWNLAKLFEDISYGGWKSNIDVVGKISVKKCRDLIVKDVQEHADLNHYHEAMRAHIHHIVEIIERRFGDL